MDKSMGFVMRRGMLALMWFGTRPAVEPTVRTTHERHGSATGIVGTVVSSVKAVSGRQPAVDVRIPWYTRRFAADYLHIRKSNFVSASSLAALFLAVSSYIAIGVADAASSGFSDGKPFLSKAIAASETLAWHLALDDKVDPAKTTLEQSNWRSEESTFTIEALGAVASALPPDSLDDREDEQGSSFSTPEQPKLTFAAAQTTDASGFKSRFPKAWEAIWSAMDLKTWQKEAAEDAIELAIEIAADPVFQENLVANLQLTAGFFIEAIKREPLRIAKTATESVGVSVAKGVTISIAANLVADAVLQAPMFETMDSSTRAVLHGLLVGTVSVGIQTVDDFRTGGIQAAVVKGAARRIVDLVEIYFASASAIAAQDRALLAVVQSLEVSVNLEASVSTDRARTIAEESVQASLALVPGIVGVDDAKAVDRLLRMARDALRLQAEGKPDAAGKLARQLRETGRLENNIRPWSALTNPLDYLTAALRRDRDIGKDAPARTSEIILRTTRLSELFMDDLEELSVPGGAQRLAKLIDILGHRLSPTASDENGWTHLHYAAALNLPNTVRSLLDRGADVDAATNWNMDWEVRNQVIDSFKLEPLDERYYPSMVGIVPLHLASRYDAMDAANVLLERGADIQAQGDSEYTPLHYAVAANSLDVARVLIERGADIHAEANWGFTPLHLAAEVNSRDVAHLLIERGADIHAQAEYGWTPLDLAAFSNAVEIALELIEFGADIHAQDEEGYTPLHSAAYGNAFEAAHLLIERGADINAKNDDGETPLDQAIQGLSDFPSAKDENSILPRVLLELVARGAEADEKSLDPLLELIARGAEVYEPLRDVLVRRARAQMFDSSVSTAVSEGKLCTGTERKSLSASLLSEDGLPLPEFEGVYLRMKNGDLVELKHYKKNIMNVNCEVALQGSDGKITRQRSFVFGGRGFSINDFLELPIVDRREIQSIIVNGRDVEFKSWHLLPLISDYYDKKKAKGCTRLVKGGTSPESDIPGGETLLLIDSELGSNISDFRVRNLDVFNSELFPRQSKAWNSELTNRLRDTARERVAEVPVIAYGVTVLSRRFGLFGSEDHYFVFSTAQSVERLVENESAYNEFSWFLSVEGKPIDLQSVIDIVKKDGWISNIAAQC